MEKVLLSAMLVVMNAGVYVILVVKGPEKVSMRTQLIFFTLFLMTSLYLGTSNDPAVRQVPNPFLFLLLFLVGP
jgi:hypothetical protein